MTAVLPKICELTTRVTRILGCNPGPMTLQGTNTYLVGTGAKRILIDTGNPGVSEYIDILKGYIQEKSIQISDILITHWHPDHIGGVIGILDNLEVGSCKVHKILDSHDISGVKFCHLQDGDTLETEGATLKIHHTPGHTDDHVIAWFEEEKAVFSGDCVLGEGTAVFENLKKLITSLETILQLNPTKIYPGHGPVVDDAIARVKTYIEHRKTREKYILDAIPTTDNEAIGIRDIVIKVYKDIPEHLHGAAAVNVGHHIQKLIEDGLVQYKSDQLANNNRTNRYYRSH